MNGNGSKTHTQRRPLLQLVEGLLGIVMLVFFSTFCVAGFILLVQWWMHILG